MAIGSDFIKGHFETHALQALSENKDIKGLRAQLKKFRVLLKQLLKKIETSHDHPFEIQEYRDLFELCSQIDQVIDKESVSKGVVVVLNQIRETIANLTIEEVCKEQQAKIPYGELLEARRVLAQRDLAHPVKTLIAEIKRESAGIEINPEWIELNCPDLFEKMAEQVRDPYTSIFDWSKLNDLLPEDVKQRSRFESRQATSPKEKELLAKIREYRHFAEVLGPEILADYLMTQYPEIAINYNYTLRIISRYLGRVTRRPFTRTDFPKVPAITLEKPDTKAVVYMNLRNYIYRSLIQDDPKTIERGSDVDQKYALRLKEVARELSGSLDKLQVKHKELLEEVIQDLKTALTIKISPRLARSILAEKGKEREVIEIAIPSLRQRVAMLDVERYKRKLIAFFMGQGKTATTFFCKEHVGAKKMLFVCPPGELPEAIERQVDKHYVETKNEKGKLVKKPTVGIVKSDMDQKELDKIKKCEIIILPYSMLSSKRDKGKITSQLLNIGIDFLAVDEVHWAKKDGGRNTEAVYDFVTKIKGLKYATLLSGNPTPNSPTDILAQLRIKDPEEFEKIGRNANRILKKMDPLLLRTYLMDFILRLERPDDWEQYVEMVNIELPEDQMRVYNVILENEDLRSFGKIKQLRHALLNPDLVTPIHPGDGYVDACFDLIKKDFEEYDSVVVAEDHYRDGITRRHESQPDKPSFVDKLKAKLEAEYGKDNVEVLVIDGKVPNRDRKGIMQKARYPEKKTVLVAKLEIISEGISLSTIHRAIILEPTMRRSDTIQFVKRFAREYNEDVKVRILNVPGTVTEGIHEHALRKHILCDRLLDGGTLSPEDTEFLEHGDAQSVIERLQKTSLKDAVLNRRQTLNTFFQSLYCKGEAGLLDFIRSPDGLIFAENYVEDWESTYSANNSRFLAGLIGRFKELGMIRGNEFADLACGPLAFECTYGLIDPSARIANFDLNQHILDAGVRLIRERKGDPDYTPTRKIASLTRLGVKTETFDVVNCALALDYLSQNARSNIHNHERAKSILEMNRILKMGGILVITLPIKICSDRQFFAFQEELGNFGFELLEGYCGYGRSTDSENGPEFQNRTIACRKVGMPVMDKIDLQNLRFSKIANPPKTSSKKRRGDYNYGSHHNEFEVNQRGFDYTPINVEEMAKRNEVLYQQLVTQARTKLIHIYIQNDNSLSSLPDETQKKLMDEGIYLTRETGAGNDRWVFSLLKQDYRKATPHYLFEAPADDQDDESE